MKKANVKLTRFCIACILLMICSTPVFAGTKTEVALNKTTATIYKGNTLRLKATINGAKGKAKWKSSKPSVATVSSKGAVKAKKTGKTTISVMVNGQEAKCVVKVVKNKVANHVKKGMYSKEYDVSGYSDGVYDKPSDYFLVLKTSKNKIKFLAGHAGVNGSPLYETNVITATVKNNKISSFKWKDTWGNKGKGSITFKKNKVTIKMKATSLSQFNRWMWNESVTIPYKSKLSKDSVNYYLSY